MSDSDSDRSSADEKPKVAAGSDDDNDGDDIITTRPLRRKLQRRVIASDDDESGDEIEEEKPKRKEKPSTLFDDSDGSGIDSGSDNSESRPSKKRHGRGESDESNESDRGSGSEDDESPGEKKTSKRRRYDEDLEDEDYELLEENLGINRDEKSHSGRLKRGLAPISDEEGEIMSDDDRSAKPSRRTNDYFDEESDEDEDGDDDIDDFIVDGGRGRGGGSRHLGSGGVGGGRGGGEGYDNYGSQELMEMFGDDFDYDDLGVEDEYEENDGDDLLGSDDEGPSVKRVGGTKLSDLYEPGLLQQRFLTETDEQVKLRDVPERIQTSHIGRELADEEELVDEADWIYANCFVGTYIDPGLKPDLKANATDDILAVLRYLRVEHFDIPFIKQYRKEYFRDHLDDGDLWEIWDWDARWSVFRDLRNNFIERYNQISAIQAEIMAEGGNVNMELTDDYLEELKRLSTPEALNDASAYIQFQCRIELDALAAKSTKRMVRKGRDLHTVAKENGLQPIVDMCCMTAKQYGENLLANSHIHKVPQAERDPDEVASEYQSQTFSSYKLVLRGVTNIVVKELSIDLGVRKYLREVFYRKVAMSVVPTSKGMNEIDNWHPLARFKFLRDKPLDSFRNSKGQMDISVAEILKGETEGLLTIKFDVEDSRVALEDRMFFQKMKDLYISSDFSPISQAWNDVRLHALTTALKLMFGHFEKELRHNIIRAIRKSVSQKCQYSIFQRVKAKPFASDMIDEDMEKDIDGENDDDEREFRLNYCILGVSIGDKDTPTVFALIDGYGGHVDYIALSNFNQRARVGVHNDPRTRDEQTLKTFIRNRRPVGIAIGSAGIKAQNTLRDVQRIVDDLHMEGPSKRKIGVEIVNSEPARIYAYSQRSKSEFEDYPEHLRFAISVGRTLQDPLLEYAGLAADKKELCSLHLTRQQDFLPKDDFYVAVCRVLIDIVNETGVKINDFYNHINQKATLQFVSGFGPRKAMGLIENLEKHGGYLLNRQELITRGYMGACMYQNCSGFIRVIEPMYDDVYDREMVVDPRDETRIHPESYKEVEKIADNALEDDEDIDEDSRPDALGMVTMIFDKPKKLDDLDLNAYAKQLLVQFNKRKHLTLEDIAHEVKHPFRDHRRNYSLTEDEYYFLMTGEDELSLQPGMKVTVRVLRIQYHNDSGDIMGVSVKLDNDMDGFIPSPEFSDNMSDPRDIEDRVEPNQHILALILSVDRQKMRVRLSCKSSVLREDVRDFAVQKDQYYDNVTEEEYLAKVQRMEEKKSSTVKPKLLHRNVQHPNFYNVNFAEAEQLLAQKAIGEAIIRPSVHNPRALTLTWKVAEGIHAHIPIKEDNRKEGFSIGRSLTIGKEMYEDLDEVIARYVLPVTELMEQAKCNKYYHQPATIEELGADLVAEKAKDPKRIPYYLSPDAKHAGRLILSYMPSRKPKFESVNLTPNGFTYRGTVLTNIHKLLYYFKTNFNKDPNAHKSVSTRDSGRGESGRSHSSNHHSSIGGRHDQSSRHSFAQPQVSSYASSRPPPPPPTPGQDTMRADNRSSRRDKPNRASRWGPVDSEQQVNNQPQVQVQGNRSQENGGWSNNNNGGWGESGYGQQGSEGGSYSDVYGGHSRVHHASMGVSGGYGVPYGQHTGNSNYNNQGGSGYESHAQSNRTGNYNQGGAAVGIGPNMDYARSTYQNQPQNSAIGTGHAKGGVNGSQPLQPQGRPQPPLPPAGEEPDQGFIHPSRRVPGTK